MKKDGTDQEKQDEDFVPGMLYGNVRSRRGAENRFGDFRTVS
ncbi:hypothetical protein [Acetobacter musti]|nr:hypothetical protein [Acetobacter musti]